MDRYTHAFTCGEVTTRLSLDPMKILGPEIDAIEAVYPEVQEEHRKQLERIERLGKLDLSTSKGVTLHLKIRSVHDLPAPQAAGGRRKAARP